MQTIWKGTVSFGLVSIPVRLYAATEERDVSFRQVHEADGGRIRYKRVCEKDGQEVPYRDIAKGYERPDGQVVVLTSEDFASLPLPSRKAIDVLQFVPVEQIDPVYFARTYYLQADGPGAKPYVLLRDALQSAGRVAVVKVALRNRESLALLRPKDGVLVLQTMLWPEEVRDSSFAEPSEDVEVRAQEVAMAESYIATLSEDFHPEAFSDDYRSALEELVAAKAGGEDLAFDEPREDTGTVVDLMAALKASVEAAKQRRSGGPASGGRPAADAGDADDAGSGDEDGRPARGRRKAASGGDSGSGGAAPTKKAATRKRSGGTAAKAKGTEDGTAKKVARTTDKAAAKATASKTSSRRKSA